jgi:G3E family GTPase
MQIPVTVFTGFLGSGKTTIIINLLKQMPKSYKIVMLKNEFGNVEVDSKLMQDSNIEVTEMLNGCLCCILVGKLGNALNEILEKYTPDHILSPLSMLRISLDIEILVILQKSKLNILI